MRSTLTLAAEASRVEALVIGNACGGHLMCQPGQDSICIHDIEQVVRPQPLAANGERADGQLMVIEANVGIAPTPTLPRQLWLPVRIAGDCRFGRAFSA